MDHLKSRPKRPQQIWLLYKANLHVKWRSGKHLRRSRYLYYYSETRFSTFFNLDSAEVLNYDAPNCPIIVKDATQLILFSSLRITNSGSDVSLLNDRFDCFKGADINAAIDTLNKLTNLDVTATTPAPITIYNIQIF